MQRLRLSHPNVSRREFLRLQREAGRIPEVIASTCVVCGATSTRHVQRRGYCTRHYQDAVCELVKTQR